MKRIALLMSLMLNAAVAAAWAQDAVPAGGKVAPAEPASAVEKPKPMPIEVCFVLDTTGSMGGLIAGAKQKIWSIANTIVKDNPKSNLKIALVPYRDRGDEYVTKVFDLTEDLDNVYKDLQTFTAAGGGDTPESVNKALQDSVEKVSWSKGEAIRIVFLVGDAPPHMDYQDDVKYSVTLEKAVRQNIIVDAIQCGGIPGTTPIWQEIARLGEGSFLQLSQTGDMVAISTPQDAKLAELNKELAKTIVPYGSVAQQNAVTEKVAAGAAAPASVTADRAVYNLGGVAGGGRGGRAVQGAGDLVNDMQKDGELIKNLKKEELPAELQKMSEAERKAFLEKQLMQREALNKQIADVAKERDAYIQKEKEKAGNWDAFDQKVEETVRDNAAAARKRQ